MKICIVTNLYPPYGRGGAEIVITRTVTELLAQGHEVVVITSRPYGGRKTLFPHLEDEANERIYRFFPLNIYHTLRDYQFTPVLRLLWHLIDMFNPFTGWVVRGVVRNEKPDVVWTHNLKGLGLTIPWFLRGLGIRHVHQVHDVQLVIPSGLMIAGREKRNPIIRFGRWCSARINRWLFSCPDVVLSPSQFLKTFYSSWGLFRRCPMIVLPNPAPKMPAVDRSIRPPGPLRLLFVGQLADHKGIRFLLTALPSFDLPFELTIAGEGALAGWVKKVAEQDKRIHYVGYVALAQLVQLLQTTDLLVVPSLCYENSPTVIYEALQAGVPVVASNIGGVAELIRPGMNGYLFPPGDETEFLAVLRRVEEQKETLRGKAQDIRDSVKELSIDRYIAKLIEVFQGK